jgi:competence protein ComEC
MKRLILFISLIGLAMMFWLTLPNAKPIIVVCDVGQGDAILATYKNIQILFDVGPKNKKVLKCLENHVPFWDKTIEAIVLSHGDSDHTGELDEVMSLYKVENFFSNGYLNKEIEQKIYSRKISQNDVININLFTFEVVSPEQNMEDGRFAFSADNDSNQNSVAGILTVKNSDWSMFLSGDMEKEMEQKLVWRQILSKSVTILKVSHHGSATATSEELLGVLKPKTAVISVGKENRFGHPTKEVLERLKMVGAEILRTDIGGDITVVVD